MSFFFVLKVLPQSSAKSKVEACLFNKKKLRNLTFVIAVMVTVMIKCQGILANYVQTQNLVNFSFFSSQELCASIDIQGSFCFTVRDDLGVGTSLGAVRGGEGGQPWRVLCDVYCPQPLGLPALVLSTDKMSCP